MSIGDTIRKFLGGSDESEQMAEYALENQGLARDAVQAAIANEGDLRDTVEGALGGLEALAAKIPGYKGYKDKEMRRESDKLLRNDVAAKLDDQRSRLSELQVQLVSQGQLDSVDDLERAVMKLQLLIDRVKTASYGYAGLFDAVKVKEEQLDALYEFDSEMLDDVAIVASDVDQVESAIGAEVGVKEAIGDLVATLADANTAFGHREEVILQA